MTRRPTHAPGEYMPIWGDPNCEVVYGHVDSDAFWSAVKSETGWDAPHIVLKHVWARWVPAQHGEFDLAIYFQRHPARGAFPVTVADV